MITDAKALQLETVPRDLQHRDGQLDYLSAALDPVTYGEPADHVAIYGPSGSGKTTLAKFALGQLDETVIEGFRWGYASAMADNSRTALLYRLVNDARLGRDLPPVGTPASAFLDRIRDYGGQVVVVLDEVDLLPEPRVLLSLYDLPNVAVVTITIGQDRLLADLDQRVQSRLRSATTITLDSYSYAELVDIVDYRVEHGLVSGRVADGAVTHIADLAAGDARDAIALLRRAATRARDEGVDVTPALVDGVREDARADVRERHKRSLGTHQRALYSIVREAGSAGIRADRLRERYEARVQEPKPDRTRTRYLESLERYGLIESNDKGGRGKRYFPVAD